MKSLKCSRVWLVLIAVLVVAVPLIGSSPVGAITNGMIDEDHLYVGALIFDFPPPIDIGLDFGWCSGTLISPTAFLTAGHCFFLASLQTGLPMDAIPIDDLFISLASNILDRKSWRPVASYETHPDFFVPAGGPFGGGNFHDVAVVFLDKPVKKVAPGTLAPLGLLTDLEASGELLKAKFTVVGYGMNEDLELTGDRRTASSRFLSPLYDNYLALSRAGQENGGACFFDSGGPAIIEVGGTEYVVAVHALAANFECEGPFWDFRVDTAVSEAFIVAAIASNG